MNITLPPELEKIIDQKIKSGRFNSPGEVVREGLRLLNEQNRIREWRLEELRGEVQKGIDEMRVGNYKSYSSGEELAEDIIREARKKFEERETNGK